MPSDNKKHPLNILTKSNLINNNNKKEIIKTYMAGKRGRYINTLHSIAKKVNFF